MSGTAVTTASPFGSVSLRSAEEMKNALSGAAMAGQIGMAPDGSEYLNFSGKRGVYEFGKDKADVSPEEVWVVNVESFVEGWTCWKGGSPAATRLASIYGSAVPTPDFQEFAPFNERNGEGWFKTKGFVLKSCDHDDRQGYLKLTSKSGVGAIADLQQSIVDRMTAGQAFWPLVMLDKETFTAQGNKNWKPVFKIYGWLSTEALVAFSETPDADLDALILESNGEGVVVQNPAPTTPAITQAVAPDPAPAAAPPAAGRRRRAAL